MKPILEYYHPHGHGSETTQQLYHGWFAALCNAAEDTFKEGVTICDYGAGPCAMGNYISHRLEDFTYYGLEPDSDYGHSVIRIAEEHLGTDSRIHLGYLETDLHIEALAEADIVILGSIFTHLTYEDFCSTMNCLLPVAEHGGKIVFSIFLGPHYKLKARNIYSMPNAYASVEFTHQQFDNYWVQHPRFEATHKGEFVTQRGDRHLIYCVERNEKVYCKI